MPIATTDFDYVRELVRRRSAIVLEPGKEYLVESRLGSLAHSLGLTSAEELLARRHQGSAELDEQIVEAMTTNETSFFRDIKAFEAVKTVVLPDLIERRKQSRTLNIWSAACSSGQEAYTLAMLILESFPELATWTIRILGTDISKEIVAKARAGSYSQIEINRGLPAKLMVKYFDHEGTRWVIKPAIRAMVEFRQMNLITPWSGIGSMDAIFLRNVLIYFDLASKTQILGEAHKALKPDGYLFLGAAETTLNTHDGFKRLQLEQAGCFQPVSP